MHSVNNQVILSILWRDFTVTVCGQGPTYTETVVFISRGLEHLIWAFFAQESWPPVTTVSSVPWTRKTWTWGNFTEVFLKKMGQIQLTIVIFTIRNKTWVLHVLNWMLLFKVNYFAVPHLKPRSVIYIIYIYICSSSSSRKKRIQPRSHY